MAKATKFILAYQEKTGWRLSGASLIGERDGFWFTVSQTGGMSQPVVVSVAVAGLTAETLTEIRASVKEHKKEYQLVRVDNKGHVVSFSLVAGRPGKSDHMDALINDMVVFFREKSIENGCHVCAEHLPVEAYRIGEGVAAICAGCQDQLKSALEATMEKNTFEGNYVTGLIGALLGSLVGSALWLAVSYIGFYASIVGFVMAYLAQFGYKLFRGRIQKGMPVIIMLSVVVGVLVANGVEIAIGLAQDPETGMSFLDALKVAPMAFYNTEYFYVGKVWTNVAVGLLFAVLGSWRTIRDLFAETQEAHYQVERI